MATIKSFTSLEQSRKLAEILPLESADMLILNNVGKSGNVDGTNCTTILKENLNPLAEVPEVVPCWSLAALLDALSKWAECINKAGIAELSYEKVTKWCVSMINCGKIKDCYADNPVDACYEMLLKLNELNLL